MTGFSRASILLVTLTFLAIVSSTVSQGTDGSASCNNSPQLCSRSYSDVTHFGAHDVAFLKDSSTRFSVSGNEFYNATIALSAGVRLLQAQIHALGSTLELCHTSCALLDAGSLEAWLADVKFWMDGNPNEVVTLILVNSDNNSTSSIGSVFEASGISKYGFAPTDTTTPLKTWPTLQEMISSGTRLVTFIASLESADSSYPYLLSEFDYVFETPFSVTSPSGFNCTVDRPSTLSSAGGSSAVSSGYLSLLNHFLDTAGIIQLPNITALQNTNSPNTASLGSIGAHLEQCGSQWRRVNFVLVDFWNVADPIEAVDALNGITPSGRASVPDSILTPGSSTSSSTSASATTARHTGGSRTSNTITSSASPTSDPVNSPTTSQALTNGAGLRWHWSRGSASVVMVVGIVIGNLMWL